jgi:phosphoglycerol transferase MdoB-like AlkP superfamily enzyme
VRQAKQYALNTDLISKDKLFGHRHGGTVLFYLLFLTASTALRLILLIKAGSNVDWQVWRLLAVFGIGILYDLVAATYFALPLMLYLSIVPQRIFRKGWHQWLMLLLFVVIIYLILFGAVAEWFFWEEFGVRFNFIAVDYLVYTTEVLGNIRESYPLPVILSALGIVSIAFVGLLHRAGCFVLWLNSEARVLRTLRFSIGVIAFGVLATLFLSNAQVPSFGNVYNQELAKNGPYSLFAAFRNNELDYEAFYPKKEPREIFPEIRKLLSTTNSTFVSETPMDITRLIKNNGPEKKWNVIQITVESLSASFLGTFGNKEHLTPNLDRLASEGMLFTQFYATGNRTDRGMEALSLSVPPTPGRSIVKRPHNEGLFTLGSVFSGKGYETSFIYSGFGYFDNMNYFFGSNGYKVIDRAAVSKSDITFANVWGACDEDLFRWVSREADESYARQKPFFHFVMTTSNHRPFTYPEGRIDIPSKSGREGAVKYTDYAIGEFIKGAQSKPWFTNTLFVIVADHCASSAGKSDLPVKQYEIPIIIYNPSLIKPAKIDTLCSQIDYPPTLLGLMNWSYKSRFYGKDVLKMAPEDERALIGNYQKLGYLKKNTLTILKPVRQEVVYEYDRTTGNLQKADPAKGFINEAIAYYETAGYFFEHKLNTALHEQ